MPTFTKSKLIRKALSLFDGLKFEPDANVVADSGDVLRPLVVIKDKDVPAEAVRDTILEHVRLAFMVCVKHEDVYRRLRGDKAFFYLILAELNSAHDESPFPPASLQKLINLFVAARRRFHAEPQPSVTGNPRLTMFIDRWVKIVDDDMLSMATRATRSVISLNAPSAAAASTVGSRSWPPAHFSPTDIAIMAQPEIRAKWFGIDHQHKVDEDAMPIYPTDQSPPMYLRSFLSWMALEEIHPKSYVSLFSAPVAFMGDEQRQDWYLTTGHKSRYYATVNEFLDYAHEQFRLTMPGTEGVKQHVLGLLTPWFYEKEWITTLALEDNEAVPITWEKRSLRAGCVIIISRLRRIGTRKTCRVVLFKPSHPHYWRASQPSNLRNKQEEWLEDLIQKTTERLEVTEGFIGGRSVKHHGPSREERGVSADTVEVSCELLQEMVVEQHKIPTTKAEFKKRGFDAMNITGED